MRLNSFKYFPYSLKFKSDFTTSINKQSTRNVFILQLRSEDGKIFYGESAPLPEFGSESFDEVESDLIRLSSIEQFEFNNTIKDINEMVGQYSSLPTVQYALEQIFIHYLFPFNFSNFHVTLCLKVRSYITY